MSASVVACPSCGKRNRIAEQLATDFAGRRKVAKVNADDCPQVSAPHQVTGIPTLLVYQGGKEVARTVGALPPAQLRAWVEARLDVSA